MKEYNKRINTYARIRKETIPKGTSTVHKEL